MDWTGTESARRPQLPCSTNYGTYSQFRIPAGTNVRICRKGLENWRDHVTRTALDFRDARRTTANGMTFQHEGWLIWVAKSDVVKST